MNIGYSQVEELLKKYTTLKASWKAWYFKYMEEIARLKSDPDSLFTREEILLTQYIGNHILSDMPHGSPSPGEKVLNVILATDEIMSESVDEKIVNSLRGLKKPIVIVGKVIVRIDYAMERLTAQERQVVEMKYFKDLFWRDISSNCSLDKRTAQRIARQAVDKIIEQLQDPKDRITMRDYEYCVKELERKEKEA